ncbi:MAG: hypothetical protein ACTTJ7_03715 [Treponema sp.]
MKKSTSIVTLMMFLLLFTATHCSNPPIFAAIEQEVKLKPASVMGIIRGIAQIKDTVYVTNGQLFSKTIGDTGSWNSIAVPASCDSIATDGSTLYAAIDGQGYMLNGTAWQPIAEKELAFVTGSGTIFATNGKKLYVVSGTAASEIGKNKGILQGAAGGYCMTTTGIYNASGAPIGGPTSELKAICLGPAGGIFVLAGAMLYAYNGSWTQCVHTVSEPQSVTYFAQKNLVLIGGKEGFEEIKLTAKDANVRNAQAITVGSAESSIAPECYYQYKNSIGKWNITPIAAFSHQTGYTLYVGVLDGQNTKHTGLWGFYHSSQLEWNRE